MAVVVRLYGLVGPTSAMLATRVVPGAAVSEAFSTNIVKVQIDDAIPGAIATLDEYMTMAGYTYLATPAAVRALELAADPAIEPDRVLVYGKEVAGVTQLFARVTDGTVYQLTPTASTTGSIAIAQGVPGDFNFNALGTVDWVFPGADGTLTSNKLSWHGKKAGGWLLNSFGWVNNGIVYTATDARAWTITAAATDDMNANGLAGTRPMPGQNGTILNCGFRMMMPCVPTARVLRWQGTMFNVDTLTTAQISPGGVAATQTMVRNTADSAGLDYRHEVTFSGPIGTWLIVDHVVTRIRVAPNGNLYVGAIGVA